MRSLTLSVVVLSALLGCHHAGAPAAEAHDPVLEAGRTTALGPAKVLKVEVEGVFTKIYLDAPYPPDTSLKFYRTCYLAIYNPFRVQEQVVQEPSRSFCEEGHLVVKQQVGDASVGHLLYGRPVAGDLAYPIGTHP